MPSSLSRAAFAPGSDRPAPAPAASLGRPRTRTEPRLSALDSLLLGAVVGVVCLVSLPQLEAHARRRNEADARAAVALLGQARWPAALPRETRKTLETGETGGAVKGSGAPRGLAAWVAADGRLRHRLRDAREVAGTDLLLHHGYFLRLEPGAGSGPCLVAWPRRAGRTGLTAFAWSAGALYTNPNPGGLWSGIEGGPPVRVDAHPWRPFAGSP